jgi:hypothetical protein
MAEKKTPKCPSPLNIFNHTAPDGQVPSTMAAGDNAIGWQLVELVEDRLKLRTTLDTEDQRLRNPTATAVPTLSAHVRFIGNDEIPKDVRILDPARRHRVSFLANLVALRGAGKTAGVKILEGWVDGIVDNIVWIAAQRALGAQHDHASNITVFLCNIRALPTEGGGPGSESVSMGIEYTVTVADAI